MNSQKEIRENESAAALLKAGAKFEKRQDRHGETKSGWWLDGVFLGATAYTALCALRGS